MKVELTRFRIKKGKEEKAQEWMDFLNSHHEDTVATMKNEKIVVLMSYGLYLYVILLYYLFLFRI